MNVCNFAVAMPQSCCHVLMTVVGCAALSDGYIAVKRDFPRGTIRSKSSCLNASRLLLMKGKIFRKRREEYKEEHNGMCKKKNERGLQKIREDTRN